MNRKLFDVSKNVHVQAHASQETKRENFNDNEITQKSLSTSAKDRGLIFFGEDSTFQRP